MDSADKIKNEIGFRKLQKAQRASSAGGHAKAANRPYTTESLQAEVTNYHRINRTWTYAEIQRKISKKYDISTKTVSNHTANPHKIENS